MASASKSNLKSSLAALVFLVGGVFAPSFLSGQTTRVLVSAPSKSLTWFPAVVAREKGFYRAEGLDVDFVIMKPQLAMQAVITGDVSYTTALGSTVRAALRGIPARVVMTICDRPQFALVVKPGIRSVADLRGKLIGISSFGASTDTLARALLQKHKLVPGQDVKILAVGGGTNRLAALKSGAVDAALMELPYNVMLESEGFHRLLFIGDLFPSPIAGLGTTLERIRKKADEVRRMVRATLRGIQYAKSRSDESVRLITKWMDINASLAEASYGMAVKTWSDSGAAGPEGVQVAIEEAKRELKLDSLPDASQAFDWTFVVR